MFLLLHVLFSRLPLPLFLPLPSTSPFFSPFSLFSFVSFHSVPPACREQPPEGTELWDPQAGGQPAEEPLGAHLAAGRLGGSVQVHETTRQGQGRAREGAEPPWASWPPAEPGSAPLPRPGATQPGVLPRLQHVLPVPDAPGSQMRLVLLPRGCWAPMVLPGGVRGQLGMDGWMDG